MYEIIVTCDNAITPDKFFELIMEVAKRQQDGSVFVDEEDSLSFYKSDFRFQREERNESGNSNKIHFKLPEDTNIGLDYGKFVNLLLNSSIWLDKNGDIVRDRNPDNEKEKEEGDKDVDFTDYVKMIRITKNQ